MSNSRQDFQLGANTAKTVQFTLTDGTNPLPLTGAGITWNLTDQPGGAPIITKTVGNGITVVDPIQGIIDLTIEAADLPDFGLYWHTLDVTPAAGQTTRCSSGRVVVDPLA